MLEADDAPPATWRRLRSPTGRARRRGGSTRPSPSARTHWSRSAWRSPASSSGCWRTSRTRCSTGCANARPALDADDVLGPADAHPGTLPGGGRGPALGGGDRRRARPLGPRRRGAACRPRGPLGARPQPRHPGGRARHAPPGPAHREPGGGGRRVGGDVAGPGHLPGVEGSDRRARGRPRAHRVRPGVVRRAGAGHAGVLGTRPVRPRLSPTPRTTSWPAPCPPASPSRPGTGTPRPTAGADASSSSTLGSLPPRADPLRLCLLAAHRSAVEQRISNRARIVLVVLAVLLLVLFLSARGIAGFYTDYLWFDSLGKRSVFTRVLRAKLGLGLVFTLGLRAPLDAEPHAGRSGQSAADARGRGRSHRRAVPRDRGPPGVGWSASASRCCSASSPARQRPASGRSGCSSTTPCASA